MNANEKNMPIPKRFYAKGNTVYGAHDDGRDEWIMKCADDKLASELADLFNAVLKASQRFQVPF